MTADRLIPDSDADAILKFWFEETKPYQWFRRDAAFDATVRDRFSAHHGAVIAGTLDHWMNDAETALARIIILDQFSRNLFRDDARAFAHDDLALAAARDAVARDLDQALEPKQRAFVLMPFMHAENLNVQEESVAMFTARLPGTDNIKHAQEHRDIVKRFGRFPHRNKALGRPSTPEEIEYLDGGGFNP